MTTAELGLITTAAVGISAAAAPVATAWANRAHERALFRAKRNYEQRRQTYIDLSIYLERQRQLLSDVLNGLATDETLDEVQDRSELGELLGRLAVDGTPEVQAELEGFASARNVTLVSLMVWLRLGGAGTRASGELPVGLEDAWHDMLQSTPPTIAGAEAVQRAMRDELTEL